MKGHFKDTVSTMVAVEKDEKVIEVWCGSWDKTICNYEYKNPPQGHSTNVRHRFPYVLSIFGFLFCSLVNFCFAEGSNGRIPDEGYESVGEEEEIFRFVQTKADVF